MTAQILSWSQFDHQPVWLCGHSFTLIIPNNDTPIIHDVSRYQIMQYAW